MKLYLNLIALIVFHQFLLPQAKSRSIFLTQPKNRPRAYCHSLNKITHIRSRVRPNFVFVFVFGVNSERIPKFIHAATVGQFKAVAGLFTTLHRLVDLGTMAVI